MTEMGQVPRRCAGVAHEIEATGECAIFDEAGGRLLVLNDLGAALWYLIDGARTVGEIIELVAEHVTVDDARLSADVTAFLGTLQDKHLIELGSP